MTDLFASRFDGFLFDMDGTILTSIVAAERAWGKWGASHGLDLKTFIPTIHGRRAIDTIAAQNIPGIDLQAEVAKLVQLEMEDVEGISPIGGAAEFLKRLPPERWALVTSAPAKLAVRRLEAAGLPVPKYKVTADDVEHGKPAPDCFLMGAKTLGFPPENCLVFEDAEVGIKAGEAAGCSVLVITETHDHVDAHGHPTTRNYEGLQPVFEGGKLLIRRD